MRDWLRVPRLVESATRGLRSGDLDRRGGAQKWSIRENVHHLVEANLVAATIVLAAMGSARSIYDWSWLLPDPAWMRRSGYRRLDPAPALRALKAVGRHVAALLAGTPGSLKRKVRLRDAPGARLRTVTVEQILGDEVEHAKHHLRDVRAIRKARRARA